MMSAKRPLSQRIFDDNNAFFRIMGIAGDLMILNLLVIVTSIPIITIGAAWTSMNRILLSMVRDEPVVIVRDYFSTFKHVWKPATILWILAAIIGVIAAIDCAAIRTHTMQSLPSYVRIAAFAGICAICIVTASVLYWSLMLLAHQNSAIQLSFTKRLILACKLAFGFLPYTLAVLVVFVVFFAIYTWLFLYAFIPIMLLGCTVPAGFTAWLVHRPLQRVQL